VFVYPEHMSVSAQATPGEVVREIRQRQRVSLRELARRVELSPATISAIETGKTGISVQRLQQLARALGVPPSSLMELDEQQRSALRPPATTDEPRGWRTFADLAIDNVLAGAIRAFVATGYHGANMRSIAREAGISVPGVYHHYASKQELLVRILDLTMGDLIWRVEQARDEADDPVEGVSLVVEALALFHARRNQLAFIGASEMRSLEPENYRRIARQRNHVQAVLDDQIAAALTEGALEVRHPHDAGKAIATMCTALAQWFRPEGPATPEQIAREYAEFAVRLLGGPTRARATRGR
jgi:AcrR family transcriptional regulator